jgi:hypothetical protein
MKINARLFALAAALLLSSHAVWAWGCEGHQTVALVASRLMEPKALEHANSLLQNFPISSTVKRFCRDTTSLPSMADAATWADDVRNKANANWHFLDVPIGFSGDFSQFCPESGCVSSALKDQLAILKSEPDGTKRADALRFIIHFAGDMHQPLHISTNNDRGGNCVPVIYLGKKPVKSSGKFRPELHGIWDTDIVEGLMKSSKRSDVTTFADFLADDAKPSRATWEAVPMDQWPNDSHTFAEKVGYGLFLTDKTKNAQLVKKMAGPENLQQCTDGNTELNDLALKIKITPAYEKAAEAAVKEQLEKAGVRLAFLLNQTFATSH